MLQVGLQYARVANGVGGGQKSHADPRRKRNDAANSASCRLYWRRHGHAISRAVKRANQRLQPLSEAEARAAQRVRGLCNFQLK